MGTGNGASVISWSQVELDGQWSAPVSRLQVGAAWSWVGEAIRLDGSSGPVRPVAGSGVATGRADERRRAARAVRLLLERVGALAPAAPGEPEADDDAGDRTVTLTDGRSAWTVALIEAGAGRPPLVLMTDPLPPRQTDLWVVSHRLDVHPSHAPGAAGGVICFTPGTQILTPAGLRPVEALREGDRVQTKDDGPAEVLWRAARRLSGARLHVMPHLAPVRLREGALDRGVPDSGLLVSPDHRLVLRGPRARALFGQDEVLVAARDLVNDGSVHVERGLREVTYIHLMLPRHAVVFANAVEAESFHPASAALASLEEPDRERLLARLPDPERGAGGYGPYARRVLARSEAALLASEARSRRAG